MSAVFWLSVLLVIHPYVTYPLTLVLWRRLRRRDVRRAPALPSISVLVPAYNEADAIAATLDALVAQDYPKEQLQVLVVSDCSDDGTDDIVRGYAGRGVELLRQPERGGKALGLNAAVRAARGEIVVFCDANARFAPDALRQFAQDFSDPDVGYVTGQLTLESPGDVTAAGGAYLRFEEWLRRAETAVGSAIGVNGGCDAIRRELYTDIPRELITDFVLPLRVIASGHRVVFDPAARSRETANAELQAEFSMRVRVALRGLQGLAHMRRLLNPLRFPGTCYCLVSHKLIRYLAFVVLATALASNVALAVDAPLYRVLLAVHLACYGLAACGLLGIGTKRLGLLAVAPAYLLMSYGAFAVASWRFVRGRTMATWKPRAG
jgi:cellulose synthase/poly-beta-1,6-N-acetylglucosamine synthase-like glycosyltransferase